MRVVNKDMTDREIAEKAIHHQGRAEFYVTELYNRLQATETECQAWENTAFKLGFSLDDRSKTGK